MLSKTSWAFIVALVGFAPIALAQQINYGPHGLGSSSNTLPTNPTGTTSTAADVMMGLSNQGGTQVPAFTPRSTGRLHITISGGAGNNTANNGVRMQIQHGTGTAPTNGAASTGTSCSQRVSLTRVSNNNDAIPFSLTCVATGLLINTAYWIDLRAAAVTGGTGAVSNLTVSVIEF